MSPATGHYTNLTVKEKIMFFWEFIPFRKVQAPSNLQKEVSLLKIHWNEYKKQNLVNENITLMN